jgi:hypothetical protein
MLELLCYEIITGLHENGRLAKQIMPIECNSPTETEAYGKKTAKIKCKKNDIVLKRQRCMSIIGV